MLDILRKREYFDWLDKGIVDQKDHSLQGIQNGWLASFPLNKRSLKVLQIGGKQPRIFQLLSSDNECWRTEDPDTTVGQGVQADKTNVKVVSTSIADLDKSLPNNYFDVVISSTFITHLAGFRLTRFLKDCSLLLRDDGLMLHSDILYVGSKPESVQSIGICRKTLESLNFEWFASSKVEDKLVFDCSFASNPDLTMYRWNNVFSQKVVLVNLVLDLTDRILQILTM